MAENCYECMLILDANAYARDPNGAANTIKELVEQNSGNLLASRLWNEQKLAYPIRGRHKGAYWISYFKMPSSGIGQFNRGCQLTDIIMRHMVIKLDPKLVDPMVAAAKGERPAVPVDSDDEKPAKGGPSSDGDNDGANSKAVETADAS